MNPHKIQKVLCIIGIALLVIEIPWFIVTQIIADKTQTRTTATVIRVDHTAANCTGDSGARPDPTCDHSDILYPVFEYYDKQGMRHVQSDQYLDGFKQNNPLGKIFGHQVGDTVTAYYTNGKPDQIVFMDGLLAYSAWLIPLFLAIPALAIGFLQYLVNRFSKK
jgi:hypothetical protein